ncbi:hypothetical protein DHEL01_v204937 [Diaporthe helianthi]|uniref:Uncharacterized protein n=1 Tax=Diaporthe helianthi TaxID=158607 RepID=A0A2P5I2B3_DIAHE|nr:hypothetical protein DHEL01_v204937 [Diaporthe helianthi]
MVKTSITGQSRSVLHLQAVSHTAGWSRDAFVHLPSKNVWDSKVTTRTAAYFEISGPYGVLWYSVDSSNSVKLQSTVDMGGALVRATNS